MKREISYAQAINEAIEEEMSRDTRVFMMGEDLRNRPTSWKGQPLDELFDDRDYPRVNLMAMENCFCEISKYLRVIYDEGRPRNVFKSVPMNRDWW